jgi:hypothetical protein
VQAGVQGKHPQDGDVLPPMHSLAYALLGGGCKTQRRCVPPCGGCALMWHCCAFWLALGSGAPVDERGKHWAVERGRLHVAVAY